MGWEGELSGDPLALCPFAPDAAVHLSSFPAPPLHLYIPSRASCIVLLCCSVCSRWLLPLKDMRDSTWPISGRQMPVVSLVRPPSSCALYPNPPQPHLFHSRLCSAPQIYLAVSTVISHLLSPLFTLCSPASDLHFIAFSSPRLQPAALSPLILLHFISSRSPALAPCKIFDPGSVSLEEPRRFLGLTLAILDMR